MILFYKLFLRQFSILTIFCVLIFFPSYSFPSNLLETKASLISSSQKLFYPSSLPSIEEDSWGFFEKGTIPWSDSFSLLNQHYVQRSRLSVYDYYSYSFSIKKGQTLIDIFLKSYLSVKEAYWAATILSPYLGPYSIKQGQRVELLFAPDFKYSPLTHFMGIKINTSNKGSILLEKTNQGQFKVSKIEKILDKRFIRAEGVIEESLFESFIQSNVPNKVMNNFLDLYSFQVDFQRDIQNGDYFEILYEGYFDENGHMVDSGPIHYLSLNLSGKKDEYFLFSSQNSEPEYFNEKGEGLKKSLLKTPTSASKISSRFGNRFHPILGHSKFHKGVDFATPTGTPIWAAGDGVVTFMGIRGGYGKVVKIRHNSTFSTLYAHMSRFPSGLQVGFRVKQKDVIGYVGSTGLSTGAHLHYEILKDGDSINPLSIKLVSNKKIATSDLQQFEENKNKLVEEFITSPTLNLEQNTPSQITN